MGGAGCTSGSRGVAGSIMLSRSPHAPPPCSAASGSRRATLLPDVVQLSPALPLPPRPASSGKLSPVIPLWGERGETPLGHPLLQPQLPGLPGLSAPALGSFTAGSPPTPHLLSHLSPAPHSLSSPASCPPAPGPGGLASLPPSDPRLHPALQPPALAAELAPLPGDERRAAQRQRRAPFIAFSPLLSKHFAFSRSAGVGFSRSCPAPNQPRHHGQGKPGEPQRGGCGLWEPRGMLVAGSSH